LLRELKSKEELIIDSWQKLVRHSIRHFNYITSMHSRRNSRRFCSINVYRSRPKFVVADKLPREKIPVVYPVPINAVFLCGRRISIPRRIIWISTLEGLRKVCSCVTRDDLHQKQQAWANPQASRLEKLDGKRVDGRVNTRMPFSEIVVILGKTRETTWLHGKNDFAEVSKNSAGYRSKNNFENNLDY